MPNPRETYVPLNVNGGADTDIVLTMMARYVEVLEDVAPGSPNAHLSFRRRACSGSNPGLGWKRVLAASGLQPFQAPGPSLMGSAWAQRFGSGPAATCGRGARPVM